MSTPGRGFPWAGPTSAMVLAAGLGTRMRPITDTLPKPLIPIAGRSLLDRILDQLSAVGVDQVVVNVHYLGEAIAQHLRQRTRPQIHLSWEAERLETGGGVLKALPLLGDAPFFVINGDVLWQDGQPPALKALATAWDSRSMDGLLLLQPTVRALGYEGSGDFHLNGDGTLRRRGGDGSAPFLFAGLQILDPRLFAACPATPFSLNVLYDRANVAQRLRGIVHAGGWCHVGTPADIPIAVRFLGATSDAPAFAIGG